MTEYWRCGVCSMVTLGEWDCEVKPIDGDGEFEPVCIACTERVKEGFIPDEQTV